MDALLTSFGLGMEQDSRPAPRNIFYRMPPTAFEWRGRYLVPEYALLLLCDRIIIDTESFHRLSISSSQPYDQVADVLLALHQEGFIKLEDYGERAKAAQVTIQRRVDAALKQRDWSEVLGASVDLWQRFVTGSATAFDRTRRLYFHGLHQFSPEQSFFFHEVANHLVKERIRVDAAQKAFDSQHDISSVLTTYLTYVETNIELSRQLRAPIHDWADYGPFYRERLANSEIQHDFDSHVTEVGRLFSLTFPELAPMNASAVIEILNDARLKTLRNLVSEAVQGNVTLDRDFAVRTLLEVLNIERRAARFRTVSSYALLPVGYIPVVGTPIAKAAEEALGISIERRTRKPYEWFYLLSDVAEMPSQRPRA